MFLKFGSNFCAYFVVCSMRHLKFVVSSGRKVKKCSTGVGGDFPVLKNCNYLNTDNNKNVNKM